MPGMAERSSGGLALCGRAATVAQAMKRLKKLVGIISDVLDWASSGHDICRGGWKRAVLEL